MISLQPVRSELIEPRLETRQERHCQRPPEHGDLVIETLAGQYFERRTGSFTDQACSTGVT